MKKILHIILSAYLAACLSFPSMAWATNYFGCQSGQAVDGNSTWCAYADLEAGSPAACTKAAAGSYAAAATVLQAGNNLYANGCAEITTDNGFNIGTGIISTADAGTGANDFPGGAFTFTTATNGAKTITANITAGTTDCLLLDGSGTGTVLTIAGNVTGSASTTAKYGVNDSRTAGTVNINGALQGGAGSNAHAVYKGASGGTLVIGGNSTAGASGMGINTGAYDATTTINGDCIGGGSISNYAVSGCSARSTAANTMTVTGNITASAYAQGVSGKIVWNPAAPANGVTGKYIKMDGGGTAVYVGTNTDDATKALTTFYYIDPTDGGSDVGTATAGGGGGAWSF